MDPILKPWITLWDYLDGNFCHVWQWANDHLSPDEVAWQPVSTVTLPTFSIGPVLCSNHCPQ